RPGPCRAHDRECRPARHCRGLDSLSGRSACGSRDGLASRRAIAGRMPGTKFTRTAEVYLGEVQRTKIVESKSTPGLIHDCAAQSHRIGIERHPKLSSALALDRMTTHCSFDVTSNVDLQEVDNALNQARKEVAQRYDFKGSKASIDFDQKESRLVLVADDEFKLNALWEIVSTRLV